MPDRYPVGDGATFHGDLQKTRLPVCDPGSRVTGTPDTRQSLAEHRDRAGPDSFPDAGTASTKWELGGGAVLDG